jgi:phosphatidylserine decarboxylase
MSWIIFLSGLMISFLTLLPIGIKWEIEKRVVIAASFIIGFTSAAIVSTIAKFWDSTYLHIFLMEVFFIALISGSLLLWRFFRDPEREPPKDKNIILSPADGKIIYIKKIEDGKIPISEKNGKKIPLNDFVQSNVLSKTGTLIGIEMNFLDVHVNRAPIDGRISLLKHIKGLFISLKKKEAVIQNERVLTVIDNGNFKIGIVQIASRLVRKIIPYVRESHEVRRGQRIGMIRFGSQVDLYLPDLQSLRIRVDQKNKVKAGISVIATFE